MVLPPRPDSPKVRKRLSADGFHREGAHLRAFGEDTPIEAEVIQGTQADAQWYSFGVNQAHGLRGGPGKMWLARSTPPVRNIIRWMFNNRK